jgi:signal transduction histidine kinase
LKHLLPRSIPGQLALVMAGALLIASLVNFVLLLGERQRASLFEQSLPAIARFADIAYEVFEAPPPITERMVFGGRRQGPGRYQLILQNPIDLRGLDRDAGLEERLHESLVNAGLTPGELRASARVIARPDRPPPEGFGPDSRGRPNPPPAPEGIREVREVILSAQLPDGRWFSSITMSPEQGRGDFVLLGVSTFVTFAFVLGAALLVARQVSRPLRDLTDAAARVGAANEPEEVVVRGHGDVRQTLEAFNAMSRRVSQLLQEKDVMLGALGHDLRTPLASLRIRIESMEPEAERQKAVRTIEEASQLLEDILELSRHGRSREPEKAMDISILVEDVVEDYVDTGAPVTLATDGKAPVALRPVLFARAMRNLIDNAVTYGGAARVSVSRGAAQVVVRIEDDGPGMSAEALATATAPFVRGESSRNRDTGGAGLGLTLADAIVKAHGGTLTLQNRSPNGLAAIITLPAAKPAA